jgi:hypothetical protein
MNVLRIIILLVVLYGCETLFLILRERHELSVSGNRVLRRMFELKGKREEGGEN